MVAKKYLIDASVIASSLEDFKRRFETANITLVLTNLTFVELESRKKDDSCNSGTMKFVKHLIDFFVRNTTSTELVFMDEKIKTKHIDKDLVAYAKENNMSVLTCDKGMALWCRFYSVDFELLEVKNIAALSFVKEDNNSLCLNLFDGSIPDGQSVYVYTSLESLKKPLESGLVYINPGDTILVAHPTENNICEIDTYFVDSKSDINLISKDIYASEDEISNSKAFHRSLFIKWTKYTASLKN